MEKTGTARPRPGPEAPRTLLVVVKKFLGKWRLPDPTECESVKPL
jgi:hypothetical protein